MDTEFGFSQLISCSSQSLVGIVSYQVFQQDTCSLFRNLVQLMCSLLEDKQSL
jgi:hypothetical protein